MIVYNVARCWFPMKADAEAYRRQLGLPAEATFKLEVTHRDELAMLLNAFMGLKAEDPDIPSGAPLDPGAAESEVVQRNLIEIPDYVPLFLVRERASGKEIKWLKTDAE